MKPEENFLLTAHNTLRFRVKSRFFVHAKSIEDVRETIAFCKKKGLQLVVLGFGSNIVFTDHFDGLVLKLGFSGWKTTIEDKDWIRLKISGGQAFPSLVQETLDAGFFGLENLALIPGSVGAAPIQNIGAYGAEIGDFVHQIHGISINSGEDTILSKESCRFGYRDSIFKHQLKDKMVIVGIEIDLFKKPNIRIEHAGLKQEIMKHHPETPITPLTVFEAVCSLRRAKLPRVEELANVGSFFKNPIVEKAIFEKLLSQFPDIVGYAQGPEQFKISAGWLIEACGYKGRRIGNVGVYPKQALVLVNYGQATGKDLLKLAHSICMAIEKKFGILLEIEPTVVEN